MTTATFTVPDLAPPTREALASFWSGQQAHLAELLATAVPEGSTVALLDYPVHGNTGDHLILLGTERWLRTINATVVGRWHVDNFSYPQFPADTILLCQGGGNFGDIYRFQKFRERVIKAYPGHRVVMLPQTIHYRDPSRLRHSSAALAGHPDLWLFVRDHRSLAIAADAFAGARPQLAPDMAAFLFPVAETLGCDLPQTPSREVLHFFRRDGERTAMPSHKSIDWDHIDPQHYLFVLGAVATGFLFGKIISVDYASRYWLDFCRGRVTRAAKLVADHHTVVTNRMHCHILASLLGVPSVVHDNSYGKCSAYFEAWHTELPFTRFATANDGGPGP
jgi:pyruvyl transferase EpsO